MKAKGFNKPVKYLIIGKPNLTKTSLMRKTRLGIFETDVLNTYEILDINKYDLSADIIIVGGKWFHIADSIKEMLVTNLCIHYKIIMIKFQELT